MRLLLDECTPKRLRRDLVGHSVQTVEEAGLKGLKNSDLLRVASTRFDALITVDQKIPRQQNLAKFHIAILVLVANSNRYERLKPLVPRALEAMKTIKSGQAVKVKA